MKTINYLAILVLSAVISAGCGTLDDSQVCSDQDGELVCMGTQEQALFNSGGISGSGYVCEETDAGRVCTCMGFADCMRMDRICMDTQSDLLGKCWIAGGEMNCRCTAISQISTDGIGTSPYLPGGQDVYAP